MADGTGRDPTPGEDPRLAFLSDAPDRRWLRAEVHYRLGEPPGRSADPDLRRAYQFVACLNDGSVRTLAAAACFDRELFAVHRIHGELPDLRAILEAAILARAPVQEAAQFCGLSEGAVRLYCSLFFDVADMLDSPGWIMAHLGALGPGAGSTDTGLALRIIGYTSGWRCLRQYVGSGGTDETLQQQLTNMFTFGLLKTGNAAVRTVEVSSRAAVGIIAQCRNLLRDRMKREAGHGRTDRLPAADEDDEPIDLSDGNIRLTQPKDAEWVVENGEFFAVVNGVRTDGRPWSGRQAPVPAQMPSGDDADEDDDDER